MTIFIIAQPEKRVALIRGCVLIISVLLSLLINACNQSDDATAIVADQRTTEISMSAFNGQIADSVYLKSGESIFLETSDDSFVSDIRRILLDDSLIFILDRSHTKITIFDTEGRYLNKIVNLGRGPDEYQQVIDIFLDRESKQLILLCDRPYKLQYYDYSGRLLRQVSTKRLYTEGTVNADGSLFMRGYDERQKFNLYLIDKHGEIEEGYFPVDDILASVNISPMWSDFLNGGQTTTYYTQRFDNAIYQIEGTDIFTKYMVDFKEYNVPEDFLSRGEDDIVAGIKSSKYVYAVYNVVETDRYLLFQTNIGFFFFDKIAGDLQGFNSIANIEFNCPLVSCFVADSDGGKIVFVKNAADVLSMAGYMKKRGFTATRFHNLADRLQATDNPVLFLYDLK